MQAIENVQSYLPVVNELPKTTEVTFTTTVNYQATLPISTGKAEDLLINAGRFYAMEIYRILRVLKNINKDAIYPIVSIIEPFMEVTEELDIDMPPISSTRGIARVRDRGTAEPEFYFE